MEMNGAKSEAASSFFSNFFPTLTQKSCWNPIWITTKSFLVVFDFKEVDLIRKGRFYGFKTTDIFIFLFTEIVINPWDSSLNSIDYLTSIWGFSIRLKRRKQV